MPAEDVVVVAVVAVGVGVGGNQVSSPFEAVLVVFSLIHQKLK